MIWIKKNVGMEGAWDGIGWRGEVEGRRGEGEGLFKFHLFFKKPGRSR